MRIRVLGYGGWLSNHWTGYTSLAIDDEVLIDVGECAHRQLMECLGKPYLRHVVITHRHGDHLIGLPTLALWARMFGDTINVYTIGDVAEAIPLLFRAVGQERLLDNINMHVFGPGEAFEVAGLDVLLVEARHTVPAVSLRIRRGDTCVVVSGDTAPNPGLAEVGRGCLLIHEASGNPGQEGAANRHGHSTTVDAVRAAAEMGATALVPLHYYVHQPVVPPTTVRVVIPTKCGVIEPERLGLDL